MLIAIIFASVLQPFVAWIRGHLPMGRGPTILLVYGAFLAVVIAMALFVLPAALGQLDRTIAALPPEDETNAGGEPDEGPKHANSGRAVPEPTG